VAQHFSNRKLRLTTQNAAEELEAAAFHDSHTVEAGLAEDACVCHVPRCSECRWVVSPTAGVQWGLWAGWCLLQIPL